MTSYNHPTDFFFFNFKNYGSDGRLSSSLPSQMIRKRLKLFGQFLSIGLSDCTLYVNYTLALLKSKIPIDLNQPVTLLSLNPEVTKESRIKKKKYTYYINLDMSQEKDLSSVRIYSPGHCLLRRLERKPRNYF